MAAVIGIDRVGAAVAGTGRAGTAEFAGPSGSSGSGRLPRACRR
jgi:hypothetical protein